MSNIKLKYPITVDGVTYNELNMRRSKVRDRLAVTAMKCSDEQKKEFKEHHPEMGDDVPIRAYPSSDQAIAMFKGSTVETDAFEVAPFFKEDFEEMNEDADSETSTVPTRKNKKTAKAVTESFL